MLYPTIADLTRGKFNRYELAIATAKCARIITNKYVSQRDKAEKELSANKETDKPLTAMIDRELRDEKAVKVAINHIYNGDYVIVRNAVEADESEKHPSLAGLDSVMLTTPIVIQDDESEDDDNKSKFRYTEIQEDTEEES